MFTSGQCHVRATQVPQLLKGGHVACITFDSASLAKSIDGCPDWLAHFDRELLTKHSYDPSDVINDVTQGEQCKSEA